MPLKNIFNKSEYPAAAIMRRYRIVWDAANQLQVLSQNTLEVLCLSFHTSRHTSVAGPNFTPYFSLIKQSNLVTKCLSNFIRKVVASQNTRLQLCIPHIAFNWSHILIQTSSYEIIITPLHCWIIKMSFILDNIGNIISTMSHSASTVSKIVSGSHLPKIS